MLWWQLLFVIVFSQRGWTKLCGNAGNSLTSTPVPKKKWWWDSNCFYTRSAVTDYSQRCVCVIFVKKKQCMTTTMSDRTSRCEFRMDARGRGRGWVLLVCSGWVKGGIARGGTARSHDTVTRLREIYFCLPFSGDQTTKQVVRIARSFLSLRLRTAANDTNHNKSYRRLLQTTQRLQSDLYPLPPLPLSVRRAWNKYDFVAHRHHLQSLWCEVLRSRSSD